ncbi:MAG: nuclear transport factor 2 family protein [Dehalococcoidia bacterium]|nr:nuclear transport factor 2 family protein [Dehalococcoidia bacterium]
MAIGDIVKKFQEAFSKGDVAALGAMYAPDAVAQHPMVPQALKGREAVRQFEGGMFAAFSAITWKASSVAVSGSTVAVEFEIGATNTAPMPGPSGMIPATNRRVELRGASFLQINAQGLIASEHRYFDTAAMMQQLGLMPK